MLEARRRRPGLPCTGSAQALGKAGRHEGGRRRQGAVILHDHIRLHVEGRGEAQEIIETDLVGAWLEHLGIVGLLVAAQAEVPFADGRRDEVILLEQQGQRQPA